MIDTIATKLPKIGQICLNFAKFVNILSQICRIFAKFVNILSSRTGANIPQKTKQKLSILSKAFFGNTALCPN